MIDEDLAKSGYFEDDATHFLAKKSQEPCFNPKEKTAFLKLLKTNGNQSKSARDLGFSYREVEWHLRKDLIFKQAFEETLLEMRHKLEGELYKAGLSPRGSREAKMWLECYFPDEYGPRKKKEVKTTDKASEEIDNLYNKLG